MSREIFELDVGQGVLAISPMPQDVADIVGWDAVLSMTQSDEMPQALAEGLANLHWLRFPVADFGVPDGADWDAIEREVLALIANKGRVLVHCKGGCGRSGMAVLRLMIATGGEPEQAFARLRAVRPCAVETKAQLDWASGASLPWPL